MSIHPLHISRFPPDPITRGKVINSAGKPISVFLLQPLSDRALLRRHGWGFYLPKGDMSVYGGVQTDVFWLNTELSRCINTEVFYDDTKPIFEPAPPPITPQRRKEISEIFRRLDNRTLKFPYARDEVARLLGVYLRFGECASVESLREMAYARMDAGAKK